MISEEKLKALLEKAAKVTATSMRVTPTMVSLMVVELLQARQQQARELQLNREADWLAEYCSHSKAKCPPSMRPSMCVVGTTVTDNSDCIKCWREEAKNEVHKQL